MIENKKFRILKPLMHWLSLSKENIILEASDINLLKIKHSDGMESAVQFGFCRTFYLWIEQCIHIMSHCYISSVWTSSSHESHTGDLFIFVLIFVAIGVTSSVWQHIVIFAWWHVYEILRSSTYKIYYRCMFRQQFPVPK